MAAPEEIICLPIAMKNQLQVVVQDDSGRVSTTDQWITSVIGSPDDKKLPPKLKRADPVLRRNKLNQDCFDPELVSIGPYHYNKAELVAGEKIKREMAEQFVQDCTRSTENDVKMVIDEARKFYCEDSIHDRSLKDDDEIFRKMLLVDGCFVVQFIHSYLENPVSLSSILHCTKTILRDSFLLENQLPMEVLIALMSKRVGKGKSDGKQLISKFVQKCFTGNNSRRQEKAPSERHNKETAIDDDCERLHLLEWLHFHVAQNTDGDINQRQVSDDGSPSSEVGLASAWSTFRSAKELASVGIHVKRSRGFRLADVKFKPGLSSSTLMLPPITVDEFTKPVLLNLVAFEACSNDCKKKLVTSFVIFMNALIDNPEDVQELRSKGILYNALGSDQDVSKVFNEISVGLVSYPEHNPFNGVKSLIENHYKNKIRRWIGEWKHTHFSRPWSVLAFIWATVTLIQAFIQTLKYFVSVFKH